MEFLDWHPTNLNGNRPVYLAIADALERDIREGVVMTGQRLPPQRELAERIGVNVSTITRAFNECRRRGLTSGTVGSGTCISADVEVNVAMFEPGTFRSSLLEMGLVYALLTLDCEIAEHIRDTVQNTDLVPLIRNVEPGGLYRHRETAAQWLSRFEPGLNPENIVVTGGSQNSLTCCLMALFRPGDSIAVDRLTYPGMKTLASMLGVRLIPIEADEGGMNPAALEKACRRTSVRGLYLMPEVQNPTTLCLDDERRAELAALAVKYDLLLLEDEAYWFSGRPAQKPMCTLIPERSVYIAGISKILGAGFRISFLAAPRSLRDPLERAVMNVSWMASPLNAEIVCRMIRDGVADSILQKKRDEAKHRTTLALDKLAPWSPRSREYGAYIWLRLPRKWITGREFELTARAAGVNVFCGEKFAVGSEPVPAAARISLTGTESREELKKGLDVLVGILSGNSLRFGPVF